MLHFFHKKVKKIFFIYTCRRTCTCTLDVHVHLHAPSFSTLQMFVCMHACMYAGCSRVQLISQVLRVEFHFFFVKELCFFCYLIPGVEHTNVKELSSSHVTKLE